MILSPSGRPNDRPLEFATRITRVPSVTCGRQARMDAAEVLTHSRTHPRMRVAALAIRRWCMVRPGKAGQRGVTMR